MANTSLSRSTTKRLIAAILLAAIVLLAIWKIPDKDAKAPLFSAAANGATSLPEKMSLPAMSAQKTDSSSQGNLVATPTGKKDTTYRPRTPRAYRQFLGTVDRNGDIDRRVPGWWLYAKSEAEASWLDNYGFPTPAEEARLRKSTDSELAALVANGDLNAKAHQAARFAKSAFTDGNVSQAGVAIGMLTHAMSEGGGPYQAFTIYGAYSDLLLSYHSLPENQRTAEQRSILDKYDSTAQLAFAYGTAFGDETMLAQFNGSASRSIVGLGAAKELSGAQVANALAAFARRRQEQGLPPMTILLRPPAPTTVSNAGTIILERY